MFSVRHQEKVKQEVRRYSFFCRKKGIIVAYICTIKHALAIQKRMALTRLGFDLYLEVNGRKYDITLLMFDIYVYLGVIMFCYGPLLTIGRVVGALSPSICEPKWSHT